MINHPVFIVLGFVFAIMFGVVTYIDGEYYDIDNRTPYHLVQISKK